MSSRRWRISTHFRYDRCGRQFPARRPLRDGPAAFLQLAQTTFSLTSAGTSVDEYAGSIPKSSREPRCPAHHGPVKCEDCMNAKALCTCALVLAVLGECAARA